VVGALHRPIAPAGATDSAACGFPSLRRSAAAPTCCVEVQRCSVCFRNSHQSSCINAGGEVSDRDNVSVLGCLARSENLLDLMNSLVGLSYIAGASPYTFIPPPFPYATVSVVPHMLNPRQLIGNYRASEPLSVLRRVMDLNREGVADNLLAGQLVSVRACSRGRHPPGAVRQFPSRQTVASHMFDVVRRFRG